MSNLVSTELGIATKIVGTSRTFFAWLIEPLAIVLEPYKDNVIVRNIPNALSVGRCVASVWVAWQIFQATSDYERQVWFIFVAGLIVSDGIDGALARRLGIESRFGAMADPFADKILIGGLVIGLGIKFDSLIFGGIAVVLLGFELGNIIAGFVGSRLAKELGCPLEAGAGMWGKMKFGVECLFVGLGWILLYKPGGFAISMALGLMSTYLASRSFFGYLHKIKLARATATSYKIPTPY